MIPRKSGVVYLSPELRGRNPTSLHHGALQPTPPVYYPGFYTHTPGKNWGMCTKTGGLIAVRELVPGLSS